MRTFAERAKAPQRSLWPKPVMPERGAQRLWEAGALPLQRAIGNQGLLRLLQASGGDARSPATPPSTLAVSTPGDASEQEADRVASAGMPENGALQRKPATAGEGKISAPASIVEQGLRSSGKPLGAATRAFMEAWFGHDFSKVRIHSDEAAAESAQGLNAAAYTLGSDVVFGHGQYLPDVPAGRRLIAHELTHVMQQTNTPAPVVQRAPLDALHKYTTATKIGEDDAKALDLAIAQSPAITRFIKDPGKLKKESGHVEAWDMPVFSSQYTDYAKALGEKPAEIEQDLKSVAGFTDRKTGQIHLLQRVANVEVGLHEAVHLNSGAQFQDHFGHYLNEGVTEHFTQAVLKEQGLDPGAAYPDELKTADRLMKDLGDEDVGQAYFLGSMNAWKKTVDAFSKDTAGPGFRTWHDRTNSSDHADWEKAADQLHAAVSRH